MKVKLLSDAQLLATPWTTAYQAPLSMGFSRQEYWSGVPLPSPAIPAKLLQILKYDTVKMLHSLSVNSEISPVATGLEKVSLHSNPKEGNAKQCLNYHTTALISHASKIVFKMLQARLQQYVNMNSQMYKLDLEKVEKPVIKLPTSVGSQKK